MTLRRHLRQLASESLVYGLAGVVSSLIGIVLVPVYTRIFSPVQYGVLSLISGTIAVVAIFAVLALDSSAHRWFWDSEETADRKKTIASWVWCQLAVSSLLALGIIASAKRLATALSAGPEAVTLFYLAALALPLSGLVSVTTNWLRMQRRPWVTMSVSLGMSLLTIGLTIALVVVAHLGLRGIFMAQAAGAALGAVAAVILLRDWLNPRHFDPARLKAMLSYALPLVPASLAIWVVGFSGRFFVQGFADTAEVGLFQVGASVATVAALATGAFQQAWGPFALSIHKQDEAREVYAAVFLAYVFLGCVLAAGLALLAPEAIRLLATERYVGASSVVGLLALNHVVVGLGYIAGLGLAVVRQTRPTGIAVVVAAVVTIGLNFALVPSFGKVGAALAILGGQIVIPAYLFRRAQAAYPIPYRFGPALGLGAITLAIIAFGGLLHISSPWQAIAVKMALLALLVPAAALCRVISPSQLRLLLQRAP